MHGIERDDAVCDMEFAEQLLRGGDFVGLFRDIDVRQDETGFDVEGVQHLGRLAVGEIVEASSERLAIDRDDTSRRLGYGAAQTSGVSAENLLDRLGFKALEDVSNRGMGGGAPPVQTEGGVQSATVHFDEGHDGAIGIAAGDDSKDREQQDILQLVELTLGPARVGDIAEQAEQLIERSHGNLLAVWLPCIRFEESAAPESATRDCWHDLRNVLPRRLNLSAQLYRALNSPASRSAATRRSNSANSLRSSTTPASSSARGRPNGSDRDGMSQVYCP